MGKFYSDNEYQRVLEVHTDLVEFVSNLNPNQVAFSGVKAGDVLPFLKNMARVYVSRGTYKVLSEHALKYAKAGAWGMEKSRPPGGLFSNGAIFVFPPKNMPVVMVSPSGEYLGDADHAAILEENDQRVKLMMTPASAIISLPGLDVATILTHGDHDDAYSVFENWEELHPWSSAHPRMGLVDMTKVQKGHPLWYATVTTHEYYKSWRWACEDLLAPLMRGAMKDQAEVSVTVVDDQIPRGPRRAAKSAGIPDQSAINVLHQKSESRTYRTGEPTEDGTRRRHWVRAHWRRQRVGPRGGTAWEWRMIEAHQRGSGEEDTREKVYSR